MEESSLPSEQERLIEKYGKEVVDEARELQKKGKYREQAVIVAINEEKEVLVSMAAKPYKQHGKEIWSLPQGGVEDTKKDIRSEAAREFEEEFGVKTDPEKLQEIDMGDVSTVQDFSLPRICSEIKNKGRKFSGKSYAFFLTRVGGKIGKLDEEEVLDYKWLSPDEAIEFLKENGAKSKFEMQKKAIEEVK